MTWKRVGIATAVLAVLFVSWSQFLIVKRVRALVTDVAGLQRHMDAEPAPSGEAMSVIMTDTGDLKIRIKSEGKNDDPNQIDYAVLDAVTKRIREAMPKDDSRDVSVPSRNRESLAQPDCGGESQMAKPSQKLPEPAPRNQEVEQPRQYFGHPIFQPPTIIQQQPRRLKQPFYRSW